MSQLEDIEARDLGVDGEFRAEMRHAQAISDRAYLLALVREQAANLERAADLHVPVMEEGNPVGCSMCDWEHPEGGAWPCGTLIALTATEA